MVKIDKLLKLQVKSRSEWNPAPWFGLVPFYHAAKPRGQKGKEEREWKREKTKEEEKNKEEKGGEVATERNNQEGERGEIFVHSPLLSSALPCPRPSTLLSPLSPS